MDDNLSRQVIDNVISNLGFILAVDNCVRNCSHCQAFGNLTPVVSAPYQILERRLNKLSLLLSSRGITTPSNLHCWRLSDPLDYHHRENDTVYSCFHIAQLWQNYLNQGLYVVTNGSDGRKRSINALSLLARTPELVSEIKLTVTPYDREWGTLRYKKNIRSDIECLAPLWEVSSDRVVGARKFRINAKTVTKDQPELYRFIKCILLDIGLSHSSVEEFLNDSSRICFKPIYDLGNKVGAPPPAGAVAIIDAEGNRKKCSDNQRARFYYGIRPNGTLFTVDMFSFQELPPKESFLADLNFDTLLEAL